MTRSTICTICTWFHIAGKFVGGLVDLGKGHHGNLNVLVAAHACLYLYVCMCISLASRPDRPVGSSSPKFKSPNIFSLTDLPNSLLAKFSHYNYACMVYLYIGTKLIY